MTAHPFICRICGRRSTKRLCKPHAKQDLLARKQREAERRQRGIERPKRSILDVAPDDDEPTQEELERIIAEQLRCLPAWWSEDCGMVDDVADDDD